MDPRQPGLFGPDRLLPAGLRYRGDLIAPRDEAELVQRFAGLAFAAFRFHGHLGRRRVVSYGWRYDFDSEEPRRTDPVPAFLLPLREAAAAFAGLAPAALEQVLLTEYQPGAAIGWHRDKAVFGEVAGVSLAAPCVLGLRRRRGTAWERSSLLLEPRSAYLLRGASRTGWEHSIPAVDALRYSVTFRTLHGG
jgi:alkylated DNA repair dioxygenase AlkB